MNPNRRPVMAGNWKMYKTAEEAVAYVTELTSLMSQQTASDLPEVVLCAPFTALDRLGQTLGPVETRSLALGAQNMADRKEGAFTGEIAPLMLLEHGVTHIILGHSERRQYFYENDSSINIKVHLALFNGMTPIVCVGESLAQREAGETDTVVRHQVTAALEGITNDQRQHLILAYEPVWAIGTGKVCEADEANRVIGLIRETVGVPEVRILYGGSMKPDNVEGLMRQPEIDGGLVGGASLEPGSFYQLIKAAMPVRV